MKNEEKCGLNLFNKVPLKKKNDVILGLRREKCGFILIKRGAT
jgi:hypothetical protein